MKTIAQLLFVGLFLVPNLTLEAASQCSQNGYTIATINGVFTNDDGAKQNMYNLLYQVGKTYNGQTIDFEYLLNPSHLGGLGDITMAAYQKVFENDTVQDYDLIEMLNAASQKVTTQKLLLVPHSQGNFYANSFYDSVAGETGGVPAKSIGIYSVANPADRVAGNGEWVTSDTDKVIAAVSHHLVANEHVAIEPNDDPLGHDFSKIYLRYLGDKMTEGIRSSLDKLSSDPSRREDTPCINPPKLTLAHKIEGAVLAVADPAATLVINANVTTARGFYAATMLASNAGQAFARSSIFAISLIGKTVVQTFAAAINSASSLVRLAANGLSGNNSASVISAVDPSSDESADVVSEQPTEESATIVAGLSDSPNQATPPPEQNSTDVVVETTTQDQPIVADSEQVQGQAATDATSTVPLAVDLGGGAAPVSNNQEESVTRSTESSPAQMPKATTTLPYASSVTPLAPIDTTLSLATTTFTGTYSNSSSFDKIVFELKNVTLDVATSSVERSIATTTGENIPYSEALVLENVGSWQYRVQLKDTNNATSTAWSFIKSFVYEKAAFVVQPTPKTIYAQSFIGTPADVGNSQQSSQVRFFSPPDLLEDVYILRVKKSSDFDCRNDFGYGYISSGDSPFDRRVAEIDGSSATTDGVHCDYRFTWGGQSSAIKAGTSVNKIVLWTVHRYDYLDGSSSNDGWSANGYNQKTTDGGYAFQLCNIAGCNHDFTTPPVITGNATTTPQSGSGTSTALSSARSIIAFSLPAGTSTAPGIVDEVAHTVTATVPFGTDVHALAPAIAVSALATSSPASGAAQDFINPVVYTVTAEDGTTQTYTVTITIAPDTTPPPTPADTPDTTLPAITSYTFNGTASDATLDLATTPSISILITANKKVKWTSITIEDVSDQTRYKRFYSGVGCVDGTATCAKTWSGDLSHGSVGVSATYRIKVNMKDSLGNIFHEYLAPYIIVVR